MSVSYDYYRIFYYVAKYHSFTRAAKILMNSQPNITRAMNNLEHELGCRLFHRSHRGVTLTPEGEKLFAHVQIAQEHLQAGEAALLDARNLESGTITIGASEIALHGLLLPVLRSFHHAYPGIHIQITNHSTPQAISAVKHGLVELAFITTPVELSKPLKGYPLKKFQDILIAGTGFTDLAKKAMALSDIIRYPLIGLGAETATHSFYDRLFENHNLLFQPDLEVATADQILPLVKYDLGLGFLPEFLAADALAKEEVIRVTTTDVIPERSICLVRDTSRPLSAAAQMLERILPPCFTP